MIRTVLTFALSLLLCTVSEAASVRKGIGCWRTNSSRQTAAARLLYPQKAGTEKHIRYTGKKRGLVILAEFTNKKFAKSHNREKYDNILNQSGYTTSEGFRGSVADYFRDQSAGLFEMEFDVVGPFTAKYDYKYYGENDNKDEDLRPQELIKEMCEAADEQVNFADYDWNGDGEVDEVFVVYAGYSEADTDNANTIWPHMWTLQEADGKMLKLDGVFINVYACANELKSSGKINGIGTFCHEFSHCLGLPDFYDITYSGQFGMGDFDIMAGGCYGGNGFIPVGYTAYEKMACGWQDPIVLGTEDATVSLKPISEQGDIYIIYNDAHEDEYYMIENRQKTGWDANYPTKGLMITHVDYDAEVWMNNIPNSIYTLKEAQKNGLTCGNDHQRMTIFHADNDDDSKYWNGQYYVKTTDTHDLYPYLRNDSLTSDSKPAATLYHKNAQGTKLMEGAILDIVQAKDGTILFYYRATKPTTDAIHTISTAHRQDGTVYDLTGRALGQDLTTLPHGLYIVDGKKVRK